ncbi:MAG: hypothetical protein IPP34_13805 [Bacteroidetes bacterium]|nr:hypothetical protein [Bacteroidota bacterium]
MGLTNWKSEDAYKVLRRDPVLKKVIRATGELSHGKNRDIYFALLQSITSQQLSAKAGDTILDASWIYFRKAIRYRKSGQNESRKIAWRWIIVCQSRLS